MTRWAGRRPAIGGALVVTTLVAVGALGPGGGAVAAGTCFGKPATITVTSASGFTVDGTPGNDVIQVVDNSSHHISAEGGNDRVCSGDAVDTVDGQGGNDRISTAGGNDALNGEGGSDLLIGGDGNDNIIAGSGDDVIRGGPGNETILAGTGNDRSLGGAGRDQINDDLDGGGDLLNGGPDRDVCTGDHGDTFRHCEKIHQS